MIQDKTVKNQRLKESLLLKLLFDLQGQWGPLEQRTAKYHTHLDILPHVAGILQELQTPQTKQPTFIITSDLSFEIVGRVKYKTSLMI